MWPVVPGVHEEKYSERQSEKGLLTCTPRAGLIKVRVATSRLSIRVFSVESLTASRYFQTIFPCVAINFMNMAFFQEEVDRLMLKGHIYNNIQ